MLSAVAVNLKFKVGNNMVEQIIEIIADYQEKDVSEYTPDQTFMEMGLDSLDIAELVLQLENEVEAEIDITPAYNTPAIPSSFLCAVISSTKALSEAKERISSMLLKEVPLFAKAKYLSVISSL